MMEASKSCNVLTAVVWRRCETFKSCSVSEKRTVIGNKTFVPSASFYQSCCYYSCNVVVCFPACGDLMGAGRGGGGLCPLWQPRHAGGWEEQSCAEVKHNSHFHSRVNSKWHKPGCSVGTCVADTQNNVGFCCPDSGSSWAQTDSPVRFGGFVIALM